MGAIRLATSTTTDEEYGGTFATKATDVAYDNTQSGLTAGNTQGAIDELSIFDETTFTNVASLGTVGQNRISKKGKYAVCVLNTWGSATFTANQLLAKIPSSISPIAYNYGVCGYTVDGVKYTTPITITNGEVRAPAPGTYTNIYLVATVLCK